MSDPFKTEFVNHDNAAKFTGLSCKLHIFSYWKCTRNNFQSYRTTAHTLSIISASYFLLRMHFVDFSRNCFGSFLAMWRRSWWDQSWEACLECHCDTFDTYRCMNSLRKRCLSICSRSMLKSWKIHVQLSCVMRIYHSHTFSFTNYMYFTRESWNFGRLIAIYNLIFSISLIIFQGKKAQGWYGTCTIPDKQKKKKKKKKKIGRKKFRHWVCAAVSLLCIIMQWDEKGLDTQCTPNVSLFFVNAVI